MLACKSKRVRSNTQESHEDPWENKVLLLVWRGISCVFTDWSRILPELILILALATPPKVGIVARRSKIGVISVEE